MPLASALPGSSALNTTRSVDADVTPSSPSVRVCVCDAPVSASPVITLPKPTAPDSKVELPGLEIVSTVLTAPRPVPLKVSPPRGTSPACAPVATAANAAMADAFLRTRSMKCMSFPSCPR